MINKGQGGPPQPPAPPLAVQELEDGIRRQIGLGGGGQGVGQTPGGRRTPNGFSGRQGMPSPHGARGRKPPQHQPESEGITAFKKLIAHRGQGKDPRKQAVPYGPSVVRSSPLPPASLPTIAPTEQEGLEQMLGGPGIQPKQQSPKPPPQQPALPTALAAHLPQHNLNTERLARPEAEQLSTGLNSGTIPLDNVLQQLSNPGLQPRQRDQVNCSALQASQSVPKQLMIRADPPMHNGNFCDKTKV